MKKIRKIIVAAIGLFAYFLILLGVLGIIFEKVYENRCYPNVFVAGVNVSGWTKEEIVEYFEEADRPGGLSLRNNISFILKFEGKEWATNSEKLKVGFDAEKMAAAAFTAGKSQTIGPIGPIGLISRIWQPVEIPARLKINEKELNKFVGQIADEVSIEPEDAVIDFDGEKIIAFKFAKIGQEVDSEKLKNEIVVGVSHGKPLQIITVPVRPSEPKITNDSLYKLGIKDLLGEGVSFFYDSIPSRIHNIKLSAAKFNGVLIKPNETFSFLKYLGPVTKLEGYKEAYVIKEGKTVLGDGGGVCQVSTTMYRAALYSGLPIVERTPHSYRVGYYEPPIGLDATVYQPGGPDLKFKNDTANNILVQTIVDEENMSLTFQFFGTSDGRVAQIADPVMVSSSPAPPPKYQDDPTLPAGTEKQIDTAHAGAKVYFTRRVLQEDEILIDEKVWSSYIPWAAVIARGTRQ